jgi:hypothetical protein
MNKVLEKPILFILSNNKNDFGRYELKKIIKINIFIFVVIME